MFVFRIGPVDLAGREVLRVRAHPTVSNAQAETIYVLRLSSWRDVSYLSYAYLSMFSVLFCLVCMHACVNECVCSVLSLVLLPCLLSAIFHFKCCYNITYKFNLKELSSVSAPIV